MTPDKLKVSWSPVLGAVAYTLYVNPHLGPAPETRWQRVRRILLRRPRPRRLVARTAYQVDLPHP
jgi:hypothetical protein